MSRSCASNRSYWKQSHRWIALNRIILLRSKYGHNYSSSFDVLQIFVLFASYNTPDLPYLSNSEASIVCSSNHTLHFVSKLTHIVRYHTQISFYLSDRYLMLRPSSRWRSIEDIILPWITISTFIIRRIVFPVDARVFNSNAKFTFVFHQSIVVGKRHSTLGTFDRLITRHFLEVNPVYLVQKISSRSRPMFDATTLFLLLISNDTIWKIARFFFKLLMNASGTRSLLLSSVLLHLSVNSSAFTSTSKYKSYRKFYVMVMFFFFFFLGRIIIHIYIPKDCLHFNYASLLFVLLCHVFRNRKKVNSLGQLAEF